MISLLMVSVIIIILVLLVVVFSRNSRGAPDRKKVLKSLPPEKLPPRQEFSVPDPAPENPQDDFLLLTGNEEDGTDSCTDIREHIKKGIQTIFDETAGIENERIKPLTRQEIDPRTIQEVTNRISGLSHFREAQIRLQKLMLDPSVQMTDLSRMILSDPVITAKILRMANSSYFGIRQKIDSISHALMLLGLLNIKNILYRESARQLFHKDSPLHQDILASLWRHSSLTSVCAQHLCDLFPGLNRGTLFTLGIVHDIGKLIIMDLPQARQLAVDFWGKYPDGILIGEEDQLFGINHAIVSGMVMESWSFSELMVRAASAHHLPPYRPSDQIGLTDEQLKYTLVLFLADQIAGLFSDWEEGIMRPYCLHPSYYPLMDKEKLIHKILDSNFLAQLREAERIALDEKGVKHQNLREKSASTLRRLPPAPSAANALGLQAIGRYKIIREVGRGATGTVYQATDILSSREVAIKIFPPAAIGENEPAAGKEHFFENAGKIAKLSHPNLVAISDVGECPGGTYVVMEYLDGTDLTPFCHKENILPLPEIVRIISATARALDFAHQNRLLHRNLKPANIRLTESQSVKITDFLMNRPPSSDLSKEGKIPESAFYWSPELAAGQTPDGRSDIFALGGILYELLSGAKPFQADSLSALFQQIQWKEPIPLKTAAPDVPGDVIDVVETCLSREKEHRFASGEEMADALTDCLRWNQFPPPV